MSTWKKLNEMLNEGPGDWNPGWRRNSMWDRADDATRTRAPEEPKPGKPQGPKGPASGPVVWHGRSMKDNDLFQTKSDKKTGNTVEGGLIPALKTAGGTISRAPDGSGIAVCPPGYKIDHTIWKEWSPTRAKAQMDAVTGGNPVKRNAYDLKGGQAGERNRLPMDPDKKSGATKMFDVLIQGRVQDNGGRQSVLVTKVVWAPVDRNSIDAQNPDARQAKLDLLMDTDNPSDLAQMFPSTEPKQNTLGKPPKPVDMAQNPLASPTSVQWTKGNAPEPAARPSSWDDIDLTRMKKKV
jgi:hypothetical protein